MKELLMRLTVIFMVCSVFLGAFPAVSLAAESGEVNTSGQCGENLKWTATLAPSISAQQLTDTISWELNADGILTITGTGSFPDFSQTPPPWYELREFIFEAEIGEGITQISKYAFADCINMQRVSVPASVENIVTDAFWYCIGLQSIQVHPDNPVFYSDDRGAVYLKEYPLLFICPGGIDGQYRVADGTLVIEYHTFANCPRLTSVYFTGDAPIFAEEAFWNTQTVVKYPADNGSWMAENLMQNYGGQLTWEGYNTAVGNEFGDGLLWELSEDGVMTISGTGPMPDFNMRTLPVDQYEEGTAPWKALVSGITEVRIMPGITSIGNYAFDECFNVTKITVPEGVTRIGDGALVASRELTEIHLPESLTYIGDSALGLPGITEITIPEAVTYIGSSALLCEQLKNLFIPQNVEYIGVNIVERCTNLESITVDPENGFYVNDAYGALLTKDMRTLMAVPGTVSAYVIPETVTEIAERAFYLCEQLQEIVIPQNVTVIGEYAFAVCTNLRSITLHNGIEKIEKWAFSDCQSLVSIEIPVKIKKLEDGLLYGCTSLQDVTLPAGLTHIGEYVFCSDDALAYIEIPDGVSHIGAHAFSHCDILDNVVLPDSVLQLRENAFSSCFGLKNITLSRNINKIRDYVFADCISLEEIVIPDEISKISNEAFAGCINLKTVIFEKNKKNNKEEKANNLAPTSGGTRATILNSTEALPEDDTNEILEIGDRAFKNCTALIYLDIPDVVVRIGEEAFVNCISLEEILLPAALTEIAQDAFCGCTALENITFTGDAPDIADAAFRGVEATAYYPGSNATWTEAVMQDYGGSITWEAGKIARIGDVNGDGKITQIDVTRLRKYLAGGWDVEIDMAAADVNGDGKITQIDVTRLRKYLAGGWDVTLG